MKCFFKQIVFIALAAPASNLQASGLATGCAATPLVLAREQPGAVLVFEQALQQIGAVGVDAASGGLEIYASGNRSLSFGVSGNEKWMLQHPSGCDGCLLGAGQSNYIGALHTSSSLALGGGPTDSARDGGILQLYGTSHVTYPGDVQVFGGGKSGRFVVVTGSPSQDKLIVEPDGTIAFLTGSYPSIERMRFDVEGNLGIGTQAPANKLHIDSQNELALRLDGSGNYMAADKANVTHKEPDRFLKISIEGEAYLIPAWKAE